MISGTASTNPFLFVLAIVLMLAWNTAGWIGLDRWVLPIVGKPWSKETAQREGTTTGQQRHPAHVASRPSDFSVSRLGWILDSAEREQELA